MKLCECGCGQPAPIATMTCRKHGRVKGQPVRFIHGHHRSGGEFKSGSKSINWQHGMTGTPEFRAYFDAKDRCTNPKNSKWKAYGGRGIDFRFKSFVEFILEVGGRPSPAHSIDRINNNGHYEPGNCRWATKAEQERNKRRRNSAS